MISCRKRFRKPDVAAPLTGGFALLALLIGACGDGDPDVALPSTSPPAAPSVSAVPTSAEGMVKQSYSQYWAVLPQAEHETNLDRRRELLGEYAAQPLLSDVLSNIDKLHDKNLTSTGHIVVRIEKVQVKGNEATVWDCQDSTNALLKNSRTGEITSRGTPNDHVRATLARGSDERWRINRITPLGRC